MQARDENNQPRLSGGDVFNVLLVPAAAAVAAVIPRSVTSVDYNNQTANALTSDSIKAAAGAGATSFVSSNAAAAAAAAKSRARRSVLISHPLLLPSSSSSGGDGSSSSNPILLLQQADSVMTQDQDLGFDHHRNCDQDLGDHHIISDLDQDQDRDGDHDQQLQEVVTAAAVGQVQDNGDGTYTCGYSCNIAGDYELHIITGAQNQITCFNKVFILLSHSCGSFRSSADDHKLPTSFRHLCLHRHCNEM